MRINAQEEPRPHDVSTSDYTKTCWDGEAKADRHTHTHTHTHTQEM